MPPGPASPARTAIVAAWPVPSWLTAPVLRMAVPATLFGWGNAAEATSPTDAPATIGFGEPEAQPPGAVPDAAGEDRQKAVPEAVPASASATAGEPAAVSDVETIPVEQTIEPEVQADTGRRTEPEPEPEPAASPPVTEGTGEAQKEAQPPTVAASPPDASAAPDGPPERPWARQLNAARPLGAPQAGSRPAGDEGSAGGVAAAEVPAVIEPEADPVLETGLAPPPADRTADRTALRNRRLYRRVKLDAGFEMDGTAAQLLDISMGGFAAANAPQLQPDATVATALRLSVDGVEISTRMRARMIYCDTPRSGGRFIDLTASQTALLRYLVTWRGQSVGAIGTTTLLDAITRWPEQGLPSAPALPPVEPERRPGLITRLLGWLRPRGASD